MRRSRYIEVSGEVARRRAKIASRKLAGSSFEYGINPEFPAYAASAELEWSALRNSTGLDGADRVVVVESKARPEYNISVRATRRTEIQGAPTSRPPTSVGGERSSLDSRIIRKLRRDDRTLHVARIAADPGTAPL